VSEGFNHTLSFEIEVAVVNLTCDTVEVGTEEIAAVQLIEANGEKDERKS